MSHNLTWDVKHNILFIKGELTRETLNTFWDWNQKSMVAVTSIDVEEVKHVDSAGLAMLIHLLNENNLQDNKVGLTGRNEKLQTLITLYNLQDVIA